MQQLELFNITSEPMNMKSSKEKDRMSKKKFTLTQDPEFHVDWNIETINSLYYINISTIDKSSGANDRNINFILNKQGLSELITKLEGVLLFGTDSGKNTTESDS
jgi:hypothetical protein